MRAVSVVFALGLGGAEGQTDSEARTLLIGSAAEVDAAPSSTQMRPWLARTTLSASEEEAEIEFAVALKMRGFDELQRRIRQHERISRREMGQRYHPVETDYQAIVDWLTRRGFNITRDDPTRLSVFAKGTVSQVARAFQVKFARVNFRGRERTSAISTPTFPTALSAAVLGVNGLQPHLEAIKHSRPLAATPHSLTGNAPPFLPRQIAKAYNAYGLAQSGAGQTIGIVIDTFPANSDLTNFWSTCGVNQSLGNMQYVQVVSGNLPAPTGEETLDVEWSSAMAQNAKVRVYATIDLAFVHLDQAYAQIYNELPSQPGLYQISLSYGLGEAYASTSQMQTDEQYFANLASAGVTVFVSSGDGGSNPKSDGTAGASTPTVEAPSNSPSVTAVGGTSIFLDPNSGAISSESVWSGTGGGVSTLFTRPSWQTGNGLPAGNKRAVPDLAAPADPNTGCLVILNGGQVQYGGTSWSAPLWAGLCAMLNEARANAGQTPLGLLGPKIYPLVGSAAFRDILNGNNGSYSATAGFDQCTGVGTPNFSALLNVLTNAPSVTSQPATQIVDAGQNATFSVVAAGGNPLTYQWMRLPAGSLVWATLADDSTYSGVATPSLVVSSASDAMRGDQFQCLITNAFGSVLTSPPAALIIGAPSAPLVVTTLAGSAGLINSTNGTGSAARFNYPGGLAVDSSGNLFVADSSNHTIRKVTAAGVVTTFAGTAGATGTTNATGASARFNLPSNVAVTSAGIVYVADSGNHLIRKITPAGVVSTLAGRAARSGSTNATGTFARFNQPLGVAVDTAGNVYVADSSNHLIRKVTPAGAATTLAGAALASGSTDGTGTAARFNYPVDVAVDPSGNIFVADTNNQTIRKITPGGVVSTFAGLAGATGSADGIGANARFNAPSGVRTDNSGNVYVADAGNHTIRFVTPEGIVTTIAGLAGSSGSADGTGVAAQFHGLSDAAPDGLGNLYISDTDNHTIRKGTASTAPTLTSPPATHTVRAGETTRFTITASGNPAPNLRWQRLPTGSATWLDLNDGGNFAGTTTATLQISNIASAMSGDAFRCVATNPVGTATSPAFLLSVQSGFASWQSARFGADAGDSSIAGPWADPDRDGLANAFEFVQGSDPLDAASGALPLAELAIDPIDQKPHLTITARLDADAGGATVSAQATGDLHAWPPDSSGTEVLSDTTAAGVRTLVFRDLTAQDAATSPARFMRLRVSIP